MLSIVIWFMVSVVMLSIVTIHCSLALLRHIYRLGSNCYCLHKCSLVSCVCSILDLLNVWYRVCINLVKAGALVVRHLPTTWNWKSFKFVCLKWALDFMMHSMLCCYTVVFVYYPTAYLNYYQVFVLSSETNTKLLSRLHSISKVYKILFE